MTTSRTDSPAGDAVMPVPFLLDNSLSIVNRTGAYHIAKDLHREFVPEFAQARYWRLGTRSPEGLLRKFAARLMMLEINSLGDSTAFLIADRVDDRSFRLFLDPLYVLRSSLTEDDIVLCHDVGPLTHSALYDPRTVENYRLSYRKICRHKPGIVFVSDWSKRNFETLHGSDFRFLETIPLYVRTELFDGPEEKVPGLDRPFFLTVGALETRKNQLAALKAYQSGGFHAQGVGYVLCGPRGRGYEGIVDFARSVPGVTLLGYVPDAQLRWLYRHAEAFVLPSLLEGFGMPALEAAHMGLVSIVSEESAMVEAVREVCIQVPANDPPAIAAAMRRTLLRGCEERAATRRQLRQVASSASKERFLARWRDLLSA